MSDIDKWIDIAKECKYLPENDLKKLCDIVCDLLLEESNIQPVSTPVTVCGDIHGQFYDLEELFRNGGPIPDTNYIFMGDFVDRGYYSLETFTRLLTLKAKWSNRITLLRGNHESRQITHVYGFYEISVIIKEPQISVNSNIIETCIMKCLKQFVGEEGCKDKFEILKYDDSNQKIILRCSNESYIRLRASLVLSNNCEEQTPFSFVINRATENLLSLRCNSRTFKHDECQNKYGNANAWKYCCRVFDLLTIAALIDEQVLCVHGGLSPLIRTLDQIRTIERNQEIPHRGAFCDLVWSDPDDVDTWTVSPRGAGWLFGSKATHMFTEINDLKLICRAHQLVQEGYRYMFNDKLITVWSAPNYCYRCGNIASILQFTTVDDRKPVLFQAVPDSERVIPPIITTPYFL